MSRQGEIATQLSFGHSWRTISSCPMPEPPVHPCEVHPERKAWAEMKCQMIKKEAFADCHDLVSSIVSPILYCIFLEYLNTD